MTEISSTESLEQPLVTHDFSDALLWLKMQYGHRARRRGWNGKDMFVFFVPGSTFEVNRPPLLGIYPAGTKISYHAHIDIRTATGEIVPWLASQPDMLANDWELLDASDAAPTPCEPALGPVDG